MTIPTAALALLVSLAPSPLPQTRASAPTTKVTPPAAAATPAASQEEAEHEALRQLRAAYEAAIRDSKPEALAPMLHPDFHAVMVTGRAVNSLADLKQYWTDIHALIGPGGKYTTTLNPERSVIVGDLALARGTSDDVVVTSGGTEFKFTTLWTAVLQKQDGRWMLRQAQGSVDPVDNIFVRTFTRRALMFTAAVAGVIGLVLGASIVGLLMRRRRAA